MEEVVVLAHWKKKVLQYIRAYVGEENVSYWNKRSKETIFTMISFKKLYKKLTLSVSLECYFRLSNFS